MHCLRAIPLAVVAVAICIAPARAADNRAERLVVLVESDLPAVHRFVEKFRATLARTGVTSRHRVRVKLAPADLTSKTALRGVIAALLAEHPAVIIASNSNVAIAARAITSDVAIVFASREDPVALGFAQSLARPGGNLTGFTYFTPIDGKRLEVLREIAPRARKLGIIVDRWWLGESGGEAVVAEARASFGYEVALFPAESEAELERVLDSGRARGMDAWYVPYTRLAYERPGVLVDAMRRVRKPAVYATTRFVEDGGLVSYEQLLPLGEVTNLLAATVGLVLDGVPPAEIPIERPKSFELAVNSDAARELGIKVPEALLKRADRVIMQTAAPAPSR